MGAVQRAQQFAPAKPLGRLAEGGRGDQGATLAHFGREEGFDDGQCLRAAGGDVEALVVDGDARLGRDFSPNVAGSPGQGPACPALLACYRDETEIADRGAVGAGVALDHHHAFAGARGDIGMGQADHAATHYRQIVYCGHLASFGLGLIAPGVARLA